jgi:type II secretory ATPase GspE/PulE/Tfp pilus assembly ATPase PilB-like protein
LVRNAGPCHGKGCEHCAHSGYAGRTGVFELLVVGEAMRSSITTKPLKHISAPKRWPMA